jgi:hypothetical protein
MEILRVRKQAANFLDLFGLFFNTENGGNMFLRNVWLSASCRHYTTDDRLFTVTATEVHPSSNLHP